MAFDVAIVYIAMIKGALLPFLGKQPEVHTLRGGPRHPHRCYDKSLGPSSETATKAHEVTLLQARLALNRAVFVPAGSPETLF